MPPPYPSDSSQALDAFVRAACPQIDGVAVDGTIFFQAGVSDSGRAAAQAAMQSFVPTDQAIEQNRRAAFMADANRVDLINRLRTATAAQIGTYVDNNTANIAEIRALLKKIILVIAMDGR